MGSLTLRVCIAQDQHPRQQPQAVRQRRHRVSTELKASLQFWSVLLFVGHLVAEDNIRA